VAGKSASGVEGVGVMHFPSYEAEGTKKLETRNPKFEAISNVKNQKVPNNGVAVKREPENIHRGGTEDTEK